MHEFGFLSIVPPLLTVVLAVYTRNVILALVLGIGCGSLILTDFHVFDAILNAVEAQVLSEISRGTQAQVILVIMVIGGFVKLLEVSGGARAFARYMLTAVSTPVKAQLLAWLSGLGIFFTDSGNSLIIGPLYRSVFEEFKLCREKLAYILDTTSSPVSILVPFIGWGAYIMGLIEQAYEEVGLTENAFSVLVKVIPFQFYAFLALLSVPIVVLSRRDYGPMLTAQRKYLRDLAAQSSAGPSKTPDGAAAEPRERLEIFLAPLGVMLVLVIGLFIWHGTHDGVTSIHIRSTLVIAYLSASITCAVMMRHYHGIGLDKSLSVFVEGAEKLVYISIVLVLAWSLSSVTNDLETAAYVSSLIGGAVPAELFPVLVFILGSVISLSTGSSYGTFAILMAIAVPVGSDLGASMYLTIAAVLSGGLIGDHISPISDTTVLASVGADCNHITHVTTQSAYAAVTGVVTAFAYMLAGYFETPAVLVIAVLMLIVLFNVTLRYFGSDAAAVTASSAFEASATKALREVP